MIRSQETDVPEELIAYLEVRIIPCVHLERFRIPPIIRISVTAWTALKGIIVWVGVMLPQQINVMQGFTVRMVSPEQTRPHFSAGNLTTAKLDHLFQHLAHLELIKMRSSNLHARWVYSMLSALVCFVFGKPKLLACWGRNLRSRSFRCTVDDSAEGGLS